MSYTPTNWQTGDIVSSEKLNKMEEGIANAHSEEYIVAETDEWLEENITQETGYVLDRSLQSANAAAPADIVGDIQEDLSDAKNAISQKQDATSYVTLSGTIVTQTGADNTMYFCGEIAELTFTAPQTGMTAIRFTSGTTPTVATFIGVTWLNGFDPTAIEASKTYEVNILNGLGCAAWT